MPGVLPEAFAIALPNSAQQASSCPPGHECHACRQKFVPVSLPARGEVLFDLSGCKFPALELACFLPGKRWAAASWPCKQQTLGFRFGSPLGFRWDNRRKLYFGPFSTLLSHGAHFCGLDGIVVAKSPGGDSLPCAFSGCRSSPRCADAKAGHKFHFRSQAMRGFQARCGS